MGRVPPRPQTSGSHCIKRLTHRWSSKELLWWSRLQWRATDPLTRPFQSGRISCNGRFQSMRGGGQTTVRNNFRNRTSKLWYFVRFLAAITVTGEITAWKNHCFPPPNVRASRKFGTNSVRHILEAAHVRRNSRWYSAGRASPCKVGSQCFIFCSLSLRAIGEVLKWRL